MNLPLWYRPLSFLFVALALVTILGYTTIPAFAQPIGVNYYVSTTGTDSGSCTSVSSPCLTLTYTTQQALLGSTNGQPAIVNLLGNSSTCSPYPCKWQEDVTIAGAPPSSGTTNTSNASSFQNTAPTIIFLAQDKNTIWDGGTGPSDCWTLLALGGANVAIQNLTIQADNNANCQVAVAAMDGGAVQVFQNVTFGSTGGTGGTAQGAALWAGAGLGHINVWSSFTVSGGGGDFAFATGGGTILFNPNLTITFTSSPSFNWIFQAVYGGVINLFNATFTGTVSGTSYSVFGNGLIYTLAPGGSGYNLLCSALPGSAPQQGTGGQCIDNSLYITCPPVVVQYTSGSGTYNVPTCNVNGSDTRVLATSLWVRIAGGGGGGGGGSTTGHGAAGGSGVTTTFSGSGVSMTANGGGGGLGWGGSGQGGPGGSATGGTLNEMYGGAGSSGTITPNASVYPSGGAGGGNPIATGGQPGMDSAGNSGHGCGGGGGGGSVGALASGYFGGGGGGAGGYVESYITSKMYATSVSAGFLPSSFTYSVGGGGTVGAGGGMDGGTGAGGCIMIVASWSSAFGR